MDSALEKVGLYDFFGVLLSGMIGVLLGQYMGISFLDFVNSIDEEVIRIIFLLLEGYFWGMILQEIGSIVDRKFIKVREKAHSCYLNNDNKIIINKTEKIEFKEMARNILKMGEKEPNESESEYVYRHCKEYVEIKGKSEKVNRINSLYAMSRSLFIEMSLIIIIYVYAIWTGEKEFSLKMMFMLLALMILFYKRMKRFAECKVLIVLRQYRCLT